MCPAAWNAIYSCLLPSFPSKTGRLTSDDAANRRVFLFFFFSGPSFAINAIVVRRRREIPWQTRQLQSLPVPPTLSRGQSEEWQVLVKIRYREKHMKPKNGRNKKKSYPVDQPQSMMIVFKLWSTPKLGRGRREGGRRLLP